MNCYICDEPSVGMCAKCGRSYCSRHGGQPLTARQVYFGTRDDGWRAISENGEVFCKVCQIGAPHHTFTIPTHSPVAGKLMSEIVEAYTAKHSSKAVLSRPQALTLLNTLLAILTDSENVWARIQIAYSLRALADYGSWVEPGSPVHQPARKGVSALLAALDDDDKWVRFAAAESLVGTRCYEGIRPIVKLWLEKETEAFPSNIMQRLQWWAQGDGDAWTEIQKVMAELDIDSLWPGIRREERGNDTEA